MKILEIEKCQQCKHKLEYRDRYGNLNSVICELTRKAINPLSDIPKWCPLPDASLTSRSSGAAGTVPFDEICHKTLCSECIDTECCFKPLSD